MDEILDEVRVLLPEGWDLDGDIFGLSFMLPCPCGFTIEQDGTCPEGCVSPLRGLL